MSLFYLPRQFVIDGAGSPRAGAKLNFYQAGTLTRQDTYSDSALSVANTNPVVADSAGEFGAIFLQTKAYRVILTDSSDVTLYDQDNVNEQGVSFGSGALVKSGNYTVTASDRGNFIEVTAEATISLLALSSAGVGFSLAVFNTSPDSVTVDPDGSETINGQTTLVIAPGGHLILTSTASEWKALEYGTTGSFTATLTGMSSSTTGTVSWFKHGNTVALYTRSQFAGTSNDTEMTLTGLPSSIQPAIGFAMPCSLRDNGSGHIGQAGYVTAAADTITFAMGSPLSSAGFTASGSKGLPAGWQIRYEIDDIV